MSFLGSRLAPQTGVGSITSAQQLREVKQGQLNCIADVTLTPNAVETVVTDRYAGATSLILLTPLTASAAAEVPTMYVSANGKFSFTVTHTNSATPDRTFRYAVFG